MSIAQASYMTESTALRPARKPIFAFILTAMIAFMAVVSSVSSVASPAASHGQNPQAVLDFLCDSGNGLGDYMSQGSWDVGMGTPHREAYGRTWTAQEAFGNNVSFVNYHGEGEAKGRWFVSPTAADRGKAVSPDAWAANKAAFEKIRTVDTCLFKAGLNVISNAGLATAGGVSRIAQVFAVFAFDSNIICPDAATATGNCINLLKVIGGPATSGASSQGLIGTLTSGVYIPLLVMVVAISALWVGYQGLAKRKFREALWGAAWITLSIIFGLTFLYKPALLAKAPMAVSNTVAACVVGGYTGNSCWDGGGGTSPALQEDGTSDSRKMCKSAASGLDMTEQMSMAVNGLSCSIWEAFVLEPYSQGSFGRSVDEMNVKDPVVAAAISKAKLNPNDFCVNLKSTGSVDSQKATLALDGSGNSICNVALYQTYLSTNASSQGDKSTMTASAPDTRWYKLILTVASDPGLWEKWSPGSVGDKILVTMVANVAAALGSLVIILISFFAIMYYLISVLMIAFAPLFFLVGVHPGRGRSILIGWAEVVVANVFKYMASAFFLIITIAFYAAVLGSVKNVGLTLLFIVVLTGALLLYRKEIVNLMGKVNMGGERLSNSMGQRFEKMGNKIGRTSLAVGGSALGAAASANPVGRLGNYADNFKQEGFGGGLKRTLSDIQADAKDDLRTIGAGATDGLKREMKKGGGLVANATRQYDRISQDNKRDLAAEANRARTVANQADDKLTTVDSDIDKLTTERKLEQDHAVTVDAQYKDAEGKENERREIDAKVVGDLSASFGGFSQMQALLNRIYELKTLRAAAVKAGDTARVAAIDSQIGTTTTAAHNLMASYPPDTVTMYGGAYQAIRNQRYAEAGVTARDVANGTISAEEAQAKRQSVNETLNTTFESALPMFGQLETSLQRLDALKTERDIALNLGDTEKASSFNGEISRLETQTTQLKTLMGDDVSSELGSQLNAMKDQRYGLAGLAVKAEDSEENRTAFAKLAADRDLAVSAYQDTSQKLNVKIDEHNALAADTAGNIARADHLQKVVEDMKPGSSLNPNEMKRERREAEYQSTKADPKGLEAPAPITFDGTTNRVMPEGITRVTPQSGTGSDDSGEGGPTPPTPPQYPAGPTPSGGGLPLTASAPNREEQLALPTVPKGPAVIEGTVVEPSPKPAGPGAGGSVTPTVTPTTPPLKAEPKVGEAPAITPTVTPAVTPAVTPSTPAAPAAPAAPAVTPTPAPQTPAPQAKPEAVSPAAPVVTPVVPPAPAPQAPATPAPQPAARPAAQAPAPAAPVQASDPSETEKRLQERLTAMEKSVAEAQSAAREATREASEARKMKGVPVAPTATPKAVREAQEPKPAEKKASAEQPKGERGETPAAPNENASSKRGKGDNLPQQSVPQQGTQGESQAPKEDKPDAARSRFGLRTERPKNEGGGSFLPRGPRR